MHRPTNRLLFLLLGTYAAASLIHFVHNAEFLRDYPGLPSSWTRGGVYFVWVAMTVVGAIGAVLVHRGREVMGLVALAVYAAIGLDSLGHYVVAPVSAHTMMMNTTILLEVGAAGLVLLEIARRLYVIATRRYRER